MNLWGASMAKSTKVPRASIACTVLDDPDLITLLNESSGIQAWAVYTLLLTAAKVQGNGGVFNHSEVVIASMLRLNIEDYRKGVAVLAKVTGWVELSPSGVKIRNYKKWNSWGGARPGAGRKPKQNQDEIKSQPKPDVPVSVSDSVSKVNYSDRFNEFWNHYPRKTGKGKAWAVFKKLSATDQHEAIEQAEAYSQAYELASEDRRQFFKHPTTWLNARGWEDDHAEWRLLIEGK